jgi:hypothetical protein
MPRSTPSAASATTPSVREVARAIRAPVVIALLALLIAIGVAWAKSGQKAGFLDPNAVDPSGSRALRVLLEQQGVQVETVRTTDSAAAAANDGMSTLLVTIPDLLQDGQVAQLKDVNADVVLVAPREPSRWFARIQTDGTAPVSRRDPACRLRMAVRAGDADMGGTLWSAPINDSLAPVECYPAGGSPSLLQLKREDSTTVTFLGAPAPLTNDRLDERGNASLALGLLGGRSHLVWYIPSLEISNEGRASLTSLLPSGLKWAVLQVFLAVGLIALWRARRLGPVVEEPLPVVVRAAEATEGRARLLRRARARDRAAANLRTATLDRLVPLVGLPRGAAPSEVIEAITVRSRRPAADVAGLLYGAAPADDSALVRLADDLDALEREVRRS